MKTIKCIAIILGLGLFTASCGGSTTASTTTTSDSSIDVSTGTSNSNSASPITPDARSSSDKMADSTRANVNTSDTGAGGAR